ncbi:MAG TPA: DNA alkylation repair protein [Planctomycetota bacterium]|nr:DNA alkylation repair protein [Planctomycetota bacterium]
MIDLGSVRRAVRKRAHPRKAEVLRRFFKTGPGEYAEGDRFLGLTVPVVRELVREFRRAPLPTVRGLVASDIHEERLLGLLLLVERYRGGSPREREAIYRTYLRSFRHINNWDLVDATAEHIVGAHLANRDPAPLRRWARSNHLWTRRIAIVSTFHGIRRNRFSPTLGIAQILLRDPHDLIHKAVGWMLREVGKRDGAALERFLRKHFRDMPRTMLRYAIERLPERRRRAYLEGTV